MARPVLFRVNNNLKIGGIQRRLRTVLPRLARDFEVHVVTYRQRGVFFDELPDLGVQTHFVRLRGKWDPLGLRRMARLFRERRAQVVHTHSLGGNVSGILAAAMARVPVRVGQVHHRGVHWYAPGALHRRKQIWEEALIHRLFSDRVLFVSQESLDYFQERTGLPRAMLTLLHNGLDFDALRPERAPEALRAEYGIDPQRTVVGFVGRLVRGKGVDYCYEFARRTLARTDRYAFVVVGPHEEQWRERARADGLEHLHYVGEQQDVAGFYALFDAFLFPSEAQWEGMPGVVLEACAFGLPVLARETAPVREIARYYDRILFMGQGEEPPAEPEAVLDKALALPPADQARFRAEFSIQAMAGRTAELYRELLAEKGVG